MIAYRTERLFYKTYEELDEQLTDLKKKGWSAFISREVFMGVGVGYENYITFKLYD